MINLKKNFSFSGMSLLNFVNLAKEEKDLVREWRNDQWIRRWMYSNHIISLAEHNQFIKKLKDDNHNFYWLVKNINSIAKSKYLGVIYLNRVDFKNKNAFLGIYSNPEQSRLGKVLITAIKKISFEKAEFHTLKLEVFGENVKAINFYKKNGFKKEGRLKEFILKDNEWKDVVIMGLVNKNYG